MNAESKIDQELPAVEVPEAFHVHDADTANWVVRKVIESRHYAERVEAWAAAELRRAKREEEFLLFKFGPQLEQWVRSELASRYGSRKSIALPGAVVGFRTSPIHLDVLDEAKLLGWCRENLREAIVTSETIAKSTVREHVEKTGECPDGATLSGGSERFFIK